MKAQSSRFTAPVTSFVREIIVIHHPYRSLRSKNKQQFSYWTGDEHYAHLVIFLKTSNDRLVFLRHIEKLDNTKVALKIAMIKKLYGELIDLAVVRNNMDLYGPSSFRADTPLPIWMEKEDYRQLKLRYNGIEK